MAGYTSYHALSGNTGAGEIAAGFTPATPNAAAPLGDGPQGQGFTAYTIGKAPDALDILPEGEPRRRLDAMRDRKDMLLARTHQLSDQMEEARGIRGKCDTDYRMVRDRDVAMRYKSSYLPDDSHPVAAQRKRALEAATVEMNKIAAKLAEAGEKSSHFGHLVAQSEKYLKAVSPRAISVHQHRRKSQANAASIGESIKELHADIHELRSAPFPSSIARAMAREQIERLAEAGCPDVASMIDHGTAGRIKWPEKVDLHVRDEARTETIPGGVALAAWLFKDALLKQIDAEISAIAEDGAAISPEDRATKIAKAEAEILELERALSESIWDKDAIDAFAEMENGIDPRALLGIDGPAPVDN